MKPKMMNMNTRSSASKVLLVADSRAAAQGGAVTPLRRFRIARMQTVSRPIPGRRALPAQTPHAEL